jgi:hypothetical protein
MTALEGAMRNMIQEHRATDTPTITRLLAVAVLEIWLKHMAINSVAMTGAD